MKSYYCTLAEARREIQAASDQDDSYVMQVIPEVSRRLRNLTGFDFEPIYETRTFQPRYNIFARHDTLYIDDKLLEIEHLTVGGTTLNVGTDLMIDDSIALRGTTLRFTTICRLSPLTICSASDRVTIAGWWGYRERYVREGWFDSGDRIMNAAGVDALMLELEVEDVDGANGEGQTPRFSPGLLLRVDDELLRVIAVDAETNQVYALRGQRGTDAAAHAQDAPIRVWSVEDDIRRATKRWAALAYQKRGVFEIATVTDVGTITSPADAPQEVKNIVAAYLGRAVTV